MTTPRIEKKHFPTHDNYFTMTVPSNKKDAPCYIKNSSKKEKEELCYLMTTPSIKKKHFPIP
jgi:hypothetical protein